MCGVDRGETCTVISTAHNEYYDQDAGDVRDEPHFYRSKIGVNEPPEGFIPVKDERPWKV